MSMEKGPLQDYDIHDVDSFAQYGPFRRKALVDYCTNEWRTNPKFLSPSPDSTNYAPSDHGAPYEDIYDRLEDYIDRCVAVVRAPKFKRLVFVSIFTLVTVILLWIKIIEPWMAEERAAYASLHKETSSDAGKLYGSNLRPQLTGLTQIGRLDAQYLPDGSRNGYRKRLIFVGDIHGCKKDLSALIQKVGFNAEHDHLVTTGDTVNKGPDSSGVVDLLMELGASGVRGNHEDRMLLMAKEHGSSSVHPKKQAPLSMNEVDAARSSRETEKALAKSLTRKQIAYLDSFPLILRIGKIKSMGEVVVVHGGLVPGLAFDNQDPAAIMHTRIIDLKTHVPSREHEAKGCIAWYKLWNKHQKLLGLQSKVDTEAKKSRHTTVIYGHDSRRGLQIHQYTKGLDTSCVNGGKLTALIINHKGKQEVVSVDCQSHVDRKPKLADLDDILRSGKLAADKDDDD